MSEDNGIIKKIKPAIDYPKVTTRDVFKEYWKILNNYRILIFFVIFINIIGTIAGGIIAPIYYKKFFDTLNLFNQGNIKDIPILINIVLFILLLNLFSWLCWRLSWFSTNYLNGHAMRDGLDKAFNYLINHSHVFFLNNFAGSLVQRVSRFARSIETLYESIVYEILALIIKIIGIFIVLFLIQPIIAYVILLWITIFLLISIFLTRIKLKYDIRASEMNSKLTGVLSDSVSNHNSIQFFSGYSNEMNRIDNINTPFMKLNIFRWNFASVIDGIQGALNISLEFFVFYFGIKYWGMNLISLGVFVLIQSYIINISNSLWGIGRVIRGIYQATADAKEMVEILHLPHEIKDIPNAKTLIVDKGEIEFRNINFAFGEDKPVFNNLNIKINAGEKVALIGHSGAGKSTLIKLLLRLHDINGGEILIDNQNINEVSQNSLRDNMSLVPQDPLLFHRTLMENIRYGKRDATDTEVIEASKMAHCDLFIKEFTNGYDTLVGERGVKLSGGERQRVAIARALLKNAPILILDEATSSLDSHSESLIQDALNILMKGKTTIIIAHRLSTIKKMDRIMVLGKEGVIEDGNHNQLIRKKGAYAKLWKLQAGGFSEKNIDDLFE